jgi:hypothetical protein
MPYLLDDNPTFYANFVYCLEKNVIVGGKKVVGAGLLVLY